jgi:hypothetical protein
MSRRFSLTVLAAGLLGGCAVASAQAVPGGTSPSTPQAWIDGAKAAASGVTGGALSSNGGSTAQQTGSANVQASRLQQTNLAQALQQFTAAVGRFAYTAGSQIPWNSNQSTTAIAYAPMQIAVPSPGFSGSASQACAFPAGTGTPLPAPLNGLVNLATLSYTPSGTNQAQALATALGGVQQYLPPKFGAAYNGVFCATVQYTFTGTGVASPPNGSMNIATWYVPGVQDSSNVTVTQVNAAYEAAKNAASGLAKPLQGAQVFYSGGATLFRSDGAAQNYWVQVQ